MLSPFGHLKTKLVKYRSSLTSSQAWLDYRLVGQCHGSMHRTWFEGSVQKDTLAVFSFLKNMLHLSQELVLDFFIRSMRKWCGQGVLSLKNRPARLDSMFGLLSVIAKQVQPQFDCVRAHSWWPYIEFDSHPRIIFSSIRRSAGTSMHKRESFLVIERQRQEEQKDENKISAASDTEWCFGENVGFCYQ